MITESNDEHPDTVQGFWKNALREHSNDPHLLQDDLASSIAEDDEDPTLSTDAGMSVLM
jgi:hypothetical protein